jgi:hypothetical protein
MSNYIKIFDTVTLTPILETDFNKHKDFTTQSNTNPLIVKIAASHSGLITRNNGFYLPDRMKKGAASFTANYGKPIQVHHDENQDPIGRVIKAEYVDISNNLKDSFLEKIVNSSNSRYGDKFIKDFISGGLPYLQSVNFIVDSLNRRDSVLDDPNYKGMGYVQITASITDPDAKQKVLDGRYLTGSVGVTTNHAICSICKQDWTGDEGRCMHKPGRSYDNAKAFLITGDLTYDEYSFVNVPADKHSGILEIHTNGITDSMKMENSVGRSISINLFNDSVDIGESTSTINTSQEELMDNKVKDLLSSLKGKFELVDDTALEAIEKSYEGLDITNMDEVDFNNHAEVQFDKFSILALIGMDVSKAWDSLKTLRPFMEETGLKTVFDKMYGANKEFKDGEEFYSALNDAEWQDYSETEDEALIAYKAEHPEDAKLSGAARKRLPGSSFCGPNKSFPVPDCAHVTAARRLIGRASVSSSTKAKILGCVSRKASAMGCGSSNKDAANTEINTEIVNKDNCSCTESEAKIKELEAQIADLNTKLGTLTTERDTAVTNADSIKKDSAQAIKDLDATRTELKLAHEDLKQMADQLVTSTEENVKLLADKTVMYKQLSGEKIEDITKFTDELVTSGFESIKDQLNQFMSKVDMTKIIDNINSGLTRNPSGTVSDPSGNVNITDKVYTKESVEKIADEALRIKFGGNSIYGRGPAAADRFIKDMQNKGLLPITG